MAPADEAVTTSADGEDDENYVPDSLADFVKRAEQGLENDLKFLEDLSSSPQRIAIDTTGSDITEAGKSAAQLGDIEAEMENVTILDKSNAKARLENDSFTSRDTDDIGSPNSRNPAARIADDEIQQVLHDRVPKSQHERSISDTFDGYEEDAIKSNDISAEASSFESEAAKQQFFPSETIQDPTKEVIDFVVNDSKNSSGESIPLRKVNNGGEIPSQETAEDGAEEKVLPDLKVNDYKNGSEETYHTGERHKMGGIKDQETIEESGKEQILQCVEADNTKNSSDEDNPAGEVHKMGGISAQETIEDLAKEEVVDLNFNVPKTSTKELSSTGETHKGGGVLNQTYSPAKWISGLWTRKENRQKEAPLTPGAEGSVSTQKVQHDSKMKPSNFEERGTTAGAGDQEEGGDQKEPSSDGDNTGTPSDKERVSPRNLSDDKVPENAGECHRNTSPRDVPVLTVSSSDNKNHPVAGPFSANISQDAFTSSPKDHAVPGASLANAMEDLNISDISASSSPGKKARSMSSKQTSASPEEVQPGLKTDGNGKMNDNKVVPRSTTEANRNAKTSKATRTSSANIGAAAKRANNSRNSSAKKLSSKGGDLSKPGLHSVDHGSKKASKPTAIQPTSRLMQPTAAARAHNPRNTTRGEASLTEGPSTSRLVRPTTSAMTHRRPAPLSKSRGTVAAPVPLTTRFTQKMVGDRAQSSGTQQTAQSSAKPSVTRSNRFMKPTAAALAHHPPASPSNQSSSTKSSRARALARLSPNSRFMQPTAATRAHHPPGSPSTKSSSTKSSRTRATAPVSPNSRFMQPTASAKAHHPEKHVSNQPSVKRKLPPVAPTSRFMQPTASMKRAHESTHAPQQLPSSKKSSTGLTIPQVSSHLLRPTAAMVARRTGTSQSKQPQKEQKKPSFSAGIKAREPGTRLRTKKNFANEAVVKNETVSGQRNKKAEADKPKNTHISLAQSTDILAKTLRSSSSTTSVNSRNKLTIPESPKFSSVRKRPVPKSSEELEWEMMEKYKAQSVKASSKPSSLHTGSSAGLTKQPKRRLTQVEPFKLSLTASSRKATAARAKGATNEEKGQQRFQARSIPKAPNPGESNAGKAGTKPGTKRAVTQPVPFKLNFAVDLTPKQRPTAKMKKTSEQPKKFKARPVPKTTFSPSIPVHPLTSPSGAKHQEKTSKPLAQQMQSGTEPKAEEEVKQMGSVFRAKEYKASPPPKPLARSSKSPTKPAPFKLESVQRHELYQELLEAKVSGEEEEFKKHLIPKALPLPESTFVYKPLSPSPSRLSNSASHES